MAVAQDGAVKADYDREGYYLARGVFSADEVRELERDFDRIVAQIVQSDEQVNARWSGPEMDRLAAQDTVVIHTHNVQLYSGIWLRAMLHPKFLTVVEQLIGPNIVLNHSKLFQKPSEVGAPFPMHQDWTYFPTVEDTMMAGIIHVSRATDEMGCLRVYPRSHKLGRMVDSSGQAEGEIFKNYPIEKAKAVPAEPGDVLFFHYFTIHGSMPNRSSAVRKTVLVQMYSGDDHVEEGNAHPDERLVLQGWNSFASRSGSNRTKF